jgi:hypothetical protein
MIWLPHCPVVHSPDLAEEGHSSLWKCLIEAAALRKSEGAPTTDDSLQVLHSPSRYASASATSKKPFAGRERRRGGTGVCEPVHQGFVAIEVYSLRYVTSN